MSTSTPVYGWTVPELTDPANILAISTTLMPQVEATIAAREVGYAEQPTSQGPSGPAIFDIAGLTVTFTAVAGRKYEIVGNCELSTTSGANQVLVLYITDGSNTIVNARNHSVIAGGYASFSVTRRVTPGAGSVTYKLRASASAGTVLACDGGSNIGLIRVHDIGT